MKYFAAIGYAIFLDGLQAGISFVLVGFFGTLSGAAAGALAGQQACSALGVTVSGWCATVGGAAGGVAGSFANPVLVPVGIMIGFVINICLSLTMGSGLLLLLAHLCGWKSLQKYIFGSIGDLIPGINNLPFWTLLAITVSMNHAKQAGTQGVVDRAVAWGLGRTELKGAMNIRANTMQLPKTTETVTRWGYQQERVDAGAETLKKQTTTRFPMQDIRSSPSTKPYAQAA